MTTTMTLTNVTNQDMGYFRFYYGDDVEMKKYVYVFGLAFFTRMDCNDEIFNQRVVLLFAYKMAGISSL